ncbi:MFS transporter [Caldalkalibacillus salinus]|uniref:MFS transporter n=1 Tax=Caldalkalibacillus salinus TaxID=2803787 RepID=UPI001923CB20|nr:MFS transporter [Caldalkalibacillus salinus]
MQTQVTTEQTRPQVDNSTVYKVLFAISFVHLLNDSVQAVIPAIFPILQESMGLTFFQLGMIGFALNMTGSVMQPVVGYYTDKRPSPYILPLGMVCTFLGMLGLALASNFALVLGAVIFVGLGSAVFHPEGSRVVYLAAGQKRGLAQSIFQVGGNGGQSLAPIMTALIFVPLGQFGAIWFTVLAAVAFVVLLFIAAWSKGQLQARSMAKANKTEHKQPAKWPPERYKAVRMAMFILLLFIFARSWYHAGVTNYYPFYLIQTYGISISEAQIYIFLFLAAGAVGTFVGGPLADRFGKKKVILFSMLGSVPFALALPFVPHQLGYLVYLINGFIILSSFSVTVVYAQELLPGKVGMASGLTIGLAFGMGAIGSLALGGLIDIFGLTHIIIASAFLPLVGILAYLLPSDSQLQEWAQ